MFDGGDNTDTMLGSFSGIAIRVCLHVCIYFLACFLVFIHHLKPGHEHIFKVAHLYLTKSKPKQHNGLNPFNYRAACDLEHIQFCFVFFKRVQC